MLHWETCHTHITLVWIKKRQNFSPAALELEGGYLLIMNTHAYKKKGGGGLTGKGIHNVNIFNFCFLRILMENLTKKPA